MLRTLPAYADASLIRTRTPGELEACDIVVDVGGQYDGAKWFDHHQRGFEHTFSADHRTKLSSAGLVYKHFGKDIIRAIAAQSPTAESVDGPEAKRQKTELDDATLAVVHRKVYEDFVEGIDAQDNGISPYPDAAAVLKFKPALSLPGMVAHLNADWNEPRSSEQQDAAFVQASDLVGAYFKARVSRTLRSWLPARELVHGLVAGRLGDGALDDTDRQILLVEGSYLPWKEHLYDVEAALGEEGKVKYVIYKDGSWRVQAVAVDAGSFVSRVPMPESWRGLRDAALDAKLREEGVVGDGDSFAAGAVFVHAAGFIGGHAEKEGALAMARASIARVAATAAVA